MLVVACSDTATWNEVYIVYNKSYVCYWENKAVLNVTVIIFSM